MMTTDTASASPPDANPEPRCAGCETVLVHSGAICHVCDTDTLFRAPIQTSPLITAPPRREAEDQARLFERSRVDTPFTHRRGR